MSTLIDELIYYATTNTEIGGTWYIAKPLALTGFAGFKRRLVDAYRVLTDKSRAYHFKEDEVE